MKKTILMSAVILLIAVFAGLAIDSEKNLTIQYNLSGRLNSPENKELVVIFSDDMLPLGGTRDGRQVLKLTPVAEGEFLWRGTRTLAFKPKGRFAYSTRYRASVPNGIRSLNGQVLKEAVNWEFATPPAVPQELRTSAQNYFTDLADREKFAGLVWVKDSVYVRFNQGVSTAGVKSFLAVRDLGSKEEARFTLEQASSDVIEIRFSAPLRRETGYRILFRKGLRGIEGDVTLGADMYWDFLTVPRFRFAGAPRTRILFDRKTIAVEFTNPLKEVRKNQVSVSRHREGKLVPLDFDINSYYQNDLRVTVTSDLNSGDALTARVDPSLANVYGESLGREAEIAIDVCSSRDPSIRSSVSGGKLEISGYSIRNAQVRLFRLDDEFYGELNEPKPGILRQPNFPERWAVGESAQSIAFGGETASAKTFDLGKLLPPKQGQAAGRGFFGVLVEKALPYNSCGDVYLYRFPIFHPFTLEVFHRRDVDFVVKATRYNTLYWVYRNRPGNPVPGSAIRLFRGREPMDIGRTDTSGLFQSDRVLEDEDLVHARTSDRDQAFFRVGNTGWNRDAKDIRIHIFSDRDFYRPGDTVHVGSVIKEFRESRIFNPGGGKAELTILDPDHQTVKTVSLPLNDKGGFSFDFQSEAGTKKGIYQLRVAYGNRQEYRPVRIDYYQPNTFSISIADMGKKYLRREAFTPKVQGAYLAGNPMSEDELEYHVRIEAEAPLSAAFNSPELQKYSFELDDYFQKKDPDILKREKFDLQGISRPRIPLERFPKTNFVGGLLFQAIGKSKEGKEFSATSRALFLPGERFAGIRVPYYNNLKQAINADLILVDAAGKEVSGEVTVSLFRRYWDNRQKKFQPVEESADIFIQTRHRHALRIKEPGTYLLKVDSPDSAGNVTSVSADFYVWDSAYSSARDQMEIIPERKEYRVGEKLKCYVQSPANGKALVTVETHKIVDSFVVDIGKTTPFELEVKREYVPDFTLNVTGLFPDNLTREARCEFTVIDSARELKVTLESPDEMKPASAGSIRLQVTDSANRPVKARVFIYCVDEGNLSLSRYQTPDLHQFFYYRKGLRYLTPIRTYYSKSYTHWSFARPTLDIELKEAGIYGCLMAPDGTPVAGGAVTLEDAKYRPLGKTTTSAAGYYHFPRIGKGEFHIRAEARGFHPTLRKCSRYEYNQMAYSEFDIVLLPSDRPAVKEGEEEERTRSEMMMAGAVAPSPMQGKRAMLMKDKAEESAPQDAAPDVSAIQVRSDFREVLFFREIETDAAGHARVDFETSDKLSTYRVMALAYADAEMGKSEKPLIVTKKLLLEEAMPEFARKDDRFRAGVQVSNRLLTEIEADIVAQPEGIDIRDARQKRIRIGSRQNQIAWFDFTAPTPGDAQVKFFAVSAMEKDGLLKKFSVFDNLVAESVLDFDVGASVRKQVQPPENAEQPRVKVKVSPSILRPAIAIAEKLVFYPYDCLEQRTSKTMPFLVLDESFAKRLELKIDAAQVSRAIGDYIGVIPEFMADDGGLSYYRGGEYSSDYLTAYVCWALTLAKRKGFAVDPAVTGKIEGYMKHRTLSPTASAFFQFVLSLNRQADGPMLRKLFAERQTLGAVGRAFLFKSIRQQQGDSENLRTLLAEFNNSLQIEADFAYFDANEPGYDRDLPFRSSRYLTALLLQAILEAQGTHPLAARIMNWLMECDPSQWHTTQTNFWILYAMNEFARKVEKGGATRAEVDLLGDKIGRPFGTIRDDIRMEKEIGGRKEPFVVEVRADQPVYVTTELAYRLRSAGPKNRGIEIARNVYDESGRPAAAFERGKIYQVEILLRADKEVPYGVIDEPIAAGFEVLRQDIATTRKLEEFSRDQAGAYSRLWLRAEYAADRIVWYSYGLKGKARITYFIKALYAGDFTWLPATAQGMYHPQYSGRTAATKVTVSE